MIELTKPRIAVMVLLTVAIAAVVESWGQPNPMVVLNTLLGTLLVASSASAVNQWLERDTDAKMQRTSNRPIPAGRISTQTVMLFAGITVFAGVLYLALFVNPTTALLGVATWVLYGIIYTPLKYRTPLNTAVGAVSGALPVLMGWTAMDGLEALTGNLRWTGLFLTVFFWQFPHFMAIAWIYREQYSEAGMKMWTVVDPSGRRAGIEAVIGALVVIPVSLIAVAQIPGATWYIVTAFTLGVLQLSFAIHFMVTLKQDSARSLLRMTLVYLPVVLLALATLPMAA